MKLHIRDTKNTNYDIDIDYGATVQQLKQQISNMKSVDSNGIKLIFRGKMLADGELLSIYNIDDGDTIKLIISGSTPSSQPTSSQQASEKTSNQQSSQPASPQTTLQQLAQKIPDLDPSFGGVPSFGSGFSGMPDLNQMGSMMQNPMFQQAIDVMLSNPEVMRDMIQSVPMLANNPIMRKQMELVMNNPEAVRQSFQLLQNWGYESIGQNPEIQRMMSDPKFIQNSKNIYGSGCVGLNPLAEQQNAQQPATASTINTAPISPQVKNIFYKITGLAHSAEIDAKLQSQKASRAVRQLIDACRTLRSEGIQLFPSVEEIGPPIPISQRSTSNSPPAPAVSYEEKFASQLQQMNDMGLLDKEKNIKALLATNGDVAAAINQLFPE